MAGVLSFAPEAAKSLGKYVRSDPPSFVAVEVEVTAATRIVPVNPDNIQALARRELFVDVLRSEDQVGPTGAPSFLFPWLCRQYRETLFLYIFSHPSINVFGLFLRFQSGNLHIGTGFESPPAHQPGGFRYLRVRTECRRSPRPSRWRGGPHCSRWQSLRYPAGAR